MIPRLSAQEVAFPLVHPFKITRGEESVARSAILRLAIGDLHGLGESAPITRYGESVSSVLAFFADYQLTEAPYALERILTEKIPAAARCALDLALHDLLGKRAGLPLYELLGVDPRDTPVTSFTIGIADPETTFSKVAEIADHPILKVKLGIGDDATQIETIASIRTHYTGTIRIDANEGWDAHGAVRLLRALEPYEIEFCEQPIPAGAPEQLRYVREHTGIPIVTDEDSCTAADLPRLAGCVDGVNIKLVKCGGIRGALAMIHTARSLGLKIMLGCMVETSLLATAAAHLSPLVDWADIDGPFLIAEDPFVGVTYTQGKLVLPNGPGLCVAERNAQ